MDVNRQKSENWLDPVINARITCHEITWIRSGGFHSMPIQGGLFFHSAPRSGTMLHTHDFSEILLVSSGKVIHRVNGEKQYLSTGNLCFLRPDDLHGFAPDPDSEKCEIVMLDFDLELFLSLSAFFENDAFLHQLTAPVLPPCFKLDMNTTSNLYARILKLNRPQELPMLRKIKLKNLLAELFARFFIDESNLLTESQIPDWIEHLCSEMRKEENLLAGFPRMRKLACRTPQHLCKYFKKFLGRSPTDFLNELRVNYSAHLLTDSNEEVTVIADKLRFQSLSRFYHLFRQYYGISPVAYRKLHQGKQRV